MDISFEGKRILVTGAGRGIGRDVALRLAQYKGTVIGLSKNQQNLDSLVQEDPRIQPLCVDLTDWDATKKAVETVLPIDLLVNNAGVSCLTPFLQTTQEDIDSMFVVNVKAVFNVSQVVAQDLIKRRVGGSIVIISSQASLAAFKGHSAYSISKAGVDMLMRIMALELGPHKIRVNCVNPTVVLTDMGKQAWSKPEKAKFIIDRIPLGRFATIDEITDPIVYLLSDRSSMINGITLPVDGGFLVT